MSIKTFNGVISRVFFKALPEADKYGNNFRMSIQMASGEWVGLGGSKKDSWVTKQGANFVEIGEGTEAFIKATETESGGKTYLNAKKGDITFINIVPPSTGSNNKQAASVPPAQGKAPAKQEYKKDMTGVRVGHATNCAVDYILSNNMSLTAEALTQYAMEFHTLTEKVREIWKKQHPDMSDFDLGATVGLAVKAAAGAGVKLDECEKVAMLILGTNASITDFVKTGNKPEAQQVKPVVKEEEHSPADLEDDIPF